MSLPRSPGLGTGAEMNCRAWGFTQEDNFERIDVDKANRIIKVRFFDYDGALVEVADEEGNAGGAKLLAMAPWD